QVICRIEQPLADRCVLKRAWDGIEEFSRRRSGTERPQRRCFYQRDSLSLGDQLKRLLGQQPEPDEEQPGGGVLNPVTTEIAQREIALDREVRQSGIEDERGRQSP